MFFVSCKHNNKTTLHYGENMSSDLSRALKLFNIMDTKIPPAGELKSKYKELMMTFHPDAYQGNDINYALEMTQEINWAYEYLKGMIGANAVGYSGDLGGIKLDTGETFYYGYVVDTVKKYDEAGYYQNKKASFKRQTMGTNYDYFCWDASIEFFNGFQNSIKHGVDEKLQNIIRSNYGQSRDFHDCRLPDYFVEHYFRKLLFWAELEYVLPYNNLCQIFKINPVTFKQKLTDTTRRLLKQEICSEKGEIKVSKNELSYLRQGIILTDLHGMQATGRRARVDSLKKGEVLSVNWFTDNPLYTDTLLVCNADNEPLGTLTNELSVCMIPLLIAGYIDVHLKVHKIQTRKQLQKQFPKLEMELRVILKNEIPNEHPALFTSQINGILNEFKDVCSLIKKYKKETVGYTDETYSAFKTSFNSKNLTKDTLGLNIYTVLIHISPNGYYNCYKRKCGMKSYLDLPSEVFKEMVRDVYVLTVDDYIFSIFNDGLSDNTKQIGKYTFNLHIHKHTNSYGDYYTARYSVFEDLEQIE